MPKPVSAIKKLFADLHKQSILPLLAAAHFENRGQSYRRRAGGVFHGLSMQSWSGAASEDRHDFTLNYSIMPATEAAVNDWWADMERPCIADRAGFLTNDRDVWYSLALDNTEDVAARIVADLSHVVLPFLDRFSTLDDIEDWAAIRRACHHIHQCASAWSSGMHGEEVLARFKAPWAADLRRDDILARFNLGRSG